MYLIDPYIQALCGAGTLQHATPFDMDGAVTDATDLTVSSTAGHDIGSSFTLTLPTVGMVGLWAQQLYITTTATLATADIGFQVGGVDHWLVYSNRPDDGTKSGVLYTYTTNAYIRLDNDLWVQTYGMQSNGLIMFYWDIQQFGMATGSQTCKVRVRKSSAGVNNLLIKGSSQIATKFRYFTIGQG